MPIDIADLKKKHGQNATNIPKKPPLVPPQSEPFFADTEAPEPETDEDKALRHKLVNQLFDENKDLDMEALFKKYYFTDSRETIKCKKTMPKTTSPLKGVREGLEDMLQIQQLQDMIKGFRDMKRENKNKGVEEEPMGDNSNMMGMLPLLQQMSGNGKLDPMMLYMTMMSAGGQNKSSNNMGQLFLMMSMLNMNNQQNQTAANGTPLQNQPINMDSVKAIYDELKNVIQQQQQQTQKIDPVTLMMMQQISKSSNQPQNSQNLEVIFDKLNTMQNNNQAQQMNMIMQQNSERFERAMEGIAGMISRERPEDKLMKNFQFFREISGDRRERSKHEMDFDIRKKEIELKEYARRDMLDREERSKEREDAKGQRIMDTAGIVLDKVIGNGLGALMGDFMSLKGGKKGKGKGTPTAPRENFDADLLDDL